MEGEFQFGDRSPVLKPNQNPVPTGSTVATRTTRKSATRRSCETARCRIQSAVRCRGWTGITVTASRGSRRCRNSASYQLARTTHTSIASRAAHTTSMSSSACKHSEVQKSTCGGREHAHLMNRQPQARVWCAQLTQRVHAGRTSRHISTGRTRERRVAGWICGAASCSPLARRRRRLGTGSFAISRARGSSSSSMTSSGRCAAARVEH